MGFTIEDGAGKGYSVEVTDELQLNVQSENHELQHHESLHNARVYQVIGEVKGLNNNTYTTLHLDNDVNKKMTVSFVRLQTVNLSNKATLPSSGTYFQIGKGRTYSSGGSDTTPTNMNFTSNKTANVTAKTDNPTMTGTFTEFDRWYPTSTEDMMIFNKQGSIIMGQNDSIEVRLVTESTSGTAYSRITFMYIE